MDPRRGDIEDDASSTKRRSLLSLAGSLLAEISLPKLAVAWAVLIVVPGLMLGRRAARRLDLAQQALEQVCIRAAGFWSAILLADRRRRWLVRRPPLFRLAESSFWSLNSLAVQPAYTVAARRCAISSNACFRRRNRNGPRSRLRAAAALVSGLVICGIALMILMAVWPRVSVRRMATVEF